ncbi:D-alanyl-D-alanine carboxypeptidase/D-alanyl-D-alanine endopeptidase [Nocardioides sp. SYSU DS0663]|uniref:D-alanyl-D-alanine carboxypeptidase/D-alanyl-D-alanine endopeptidase n=1 Tax=Nocardioides sp. SYSU DS0663 TaxID=3416445 RepID=UPI003F4BDEB7
MARRDARHSRVLVVLVLLVAVAAGTAGAWRYGALDPWLGPATPTDPARVAPPEGLDLPAVVDPPEVAGPPSAPGPATARAVRRALAPYLSDEDLGPHVLAAVAPLDGAGVLLRSGRGRGELAIPASTTKVVTGAAALLAMDPGTRFETSVVTDGRGAVSGVVLVGGGDPFLARRPAAPDEPTWPERADVATLARETAAALVAEGRRRVRVGYDASLFTGPAESPRWRADYVPDGIVSPVSALWVDEGRPTEGSGRVADPARAAAGAFAAALRRSGIEVAGAPQPREAPADAEQLAVVRSAPLGQVVEQVLAVSDNEAAEVLLRHVGLAVEGEGSFAAGRRGVERVLAGAGVDLGRSVLWDGSGLSRESRLDPVALLDVLRLAGSEEELRPVLTGLPVAAFTGSLADRFQTAPPAGRGRVRAKTGTLTGVTSLAGTATDLAGHTFVFALMADRVREEDTLEARDAMDAAAGALGACRCG